MMPTEVGQRETDNQDVHHFFSVEDVDYLELYVGNAKQAAYYFCQAFGFKIVAYSGLETGNREKVSYLLQQKHIQLLISGAFSQGSSHCPVCEETWGWG